PAGWPPTIAVPITTALVGKSNSRTPSPMGVRAPTRSAPSTATTTGTTISFRIHAGPPGAGWGWSPGAVVSLIPGATSAGVGERYGSLSNVDILQSPRRHGSVITHPCARVSRPVLTP